MSGELGERSSVVHRALGTREKASDSSLSRDGKLLLLSIFVNSIPIGYMNVVPLVYLYDIGYSPSVIGAIYAASAVANTVGLIPAGFLADKYGRKNFLIIGSLMPCASYAIFGITLDPYWLLVASVVGGVGLAGGLAVALSSPALLPMLADSTTDKNRTKFFGITQGVWTISLTLGSLISFLPALLVGLGLANGSTEAHSASYFLMSVLVVASVVPLVFVKEESKRGQPVVVAEVVPRHLDDEIVAGAGPIERRTILSKISNAAKPRLSITSGREIAKFSVVLGLSGLGFGVLVQLLPTWYTLRFGASETTVGLWMALAEFVSVVAIPFIPKLVRRRGTVAVAAATGVAASLFLGSMVLAGSFALAASLFVVRNFFVTISWPVTQSYMMGVVEESERASAVAIATAAWGIANSLGTAFGGELLSLRLLPLPFLVGVACYLGYSLTLFMFFRKLKPPEEIESKPDRTQSQAENPSRKQKAVKTH